MHTYKLPKLPKTKEETAITICSGGIFCNDAAWLYVKSIKPKYKMLIITPEIIAEFIITCVILVLDASSCFLCRLTNWKAITAKKHVANRSMVPYPRVSELFKASVVVTEFKATILGSQGKIPKIIKITAVTILIGLKIFPKISITLFFL